VKLIDQERLHALLRKDICGLKVSQMAVLKKPLIRALGRLLAEVRLEAYNKGYDDGFSDGMSSEGL
jgi:hypothetical protein